MHERIRGWGFASLLVMAGLGGCSGKDEATEPAKPPANTDLNAIAPAPAAGAGWQFKTGPFSVAAGEEKQICYFVSVPAEADAFVNRIVLAQQPGSHHLNVFRVKTVKNLGGQNGDVVDGGECWKSANWSDWPIVVNSQQSEPGKNVVDWSLPEGVAQKFVPGELLMIQSHYVNATTQVTPGVGEAVINFHKMDASKVTAELGTVFATNQNVKVCPGETDRSYTATCRFAKSPVTIVAANGHFHSRGRAFTIAPYDDQGNVGASFYTSHSWDDPPFETNVAVPIPAQGGISWTCDFAAPAASCGDPANQCCFTFGGHVETQEHCNAFVYYYPKQDDINCF